LWPRLVSVSGILEFAIWFLFFGRQRLFLGQSPVLFFAVPCPLRFVVVDMHPVPILLFLLVFVLPLFFDPVPPFSWSFDDALAVAVLWRLLLPFQAILASLDVLVRRPLFVALFHDIFLVLVQFQKHFFFSLHCCVAVARVPLQACRTPLRIDLCHAVGRRRSFLFLGGVLEGFLGEIARIVATVTVVIVVIVATAVTAIEHCHCRCRPATRTVMTTHCSCLVLLLEAHVFSFLGVANGSVEVIQSSFAWGIPHNCFWWGWKHPRYTSRAVSFCSTPF
jgi:hypothetical protein